MILAAGATLDPIQLLLINAGTAGVVVVLILVGWLWAKPSVEREFKKSDDKDAQQQVLISSMLADQKEVIPLLLEVDKRVVPLMENTQIMLKRVEALLDRMEREWDWRERRGRVQEEASRDRSGRDLEDRGRGGGGEGTGTGDYQSGETRPR
jgi:hypothetical protein